MIIKKPYAFLIKNFKKIHVFLFLISIYIFVKITDIREFVAVFREFGSYDSYAEPITRYVTGLSQFVLLLIIAGTVSLLILLKHKEKPWKMYIVPIVTYSLTLLVFLITKGYFNSYTGQTDTTGIRLIDSLLFIVYIFQYPALILWFVRGFGIDIKNFEFHKDEEYLELDQEDHEELEINIEVDKEGIKRVFKRALRHMNYVYQEHKLLFNAIAVIILFIIFKNGYEYIFITNKAYKQGDTFDANGYTITINNSYYSDKDYTGNIINKKSSFVVLDLTIKNNLESRKLDLSGFHVMNGTNNYSHTSNVYETEFHDLGETYDSVNEVGRDRTVNIIIIYKVDKKLPIDKYVLYYQELDKEKPHLRKIKLNINDLSKIKKHKEINLLEDMTFTVKNKEETVSFDEIEFTNEIEYTYGFCNTSSCNIKRNVQPAKTGKKIMTIYFASDTYEGKEMIDFSTKYGKINYIDSKNKEQSIEVVNTLNTTYYGKYLYISVPKEVETSEKIQLEYTVRNNKYIYNLK